MPQSIELALANLQSKSTTAGCAMAPSVAIEQLGPTPFSLAYEESGVEEFYSVGHAKDRPVLIIEHHVSKSILPKDIAKASALRDVFLKAIRDDPTLGDTCNTVVSVRRRFGKMKFGTMDTIGYRYEITIDITLSA